MTLTEQEEGERASPPEPPRTGRRRALVEWIVILMIALVASLLIKTFAIQAFFVPSTSMWPTLKPHDRVLVNKLAYDFHPVHEGDIVVFRRPPLDTDTAVPDLIKRVVGLPGQTIYVANCRVYINGKPLKQPYLPRGWQLATSPYCTTWTPSYPNPYKVPLGHYFVMGDNRKDSYDSRYWGPLPSNYIVGRAFLRVWPPSRVGSL